MKMKTHEDDWNIYENRKWISERNTSESTKKPRISVHLEKLKSEKKTCPTCSTSSKGCRKAPDLELHWRITSMHKLRRTNSRKQTDAADDPASSDAWTWSCIFRTLSWKTRKSS